MEPVLVPGVGGSVKREREVIGMHHGASSLGAPHLSVSWWNRQKERTGSERVWDLHYSRPLVFMPGPQAAQIRVILSIQAADLRPKLPLFCSLFSG